MAVCVKYWYESRRHYLFKDGETQAQLLSVGQDYDRVLFAVVFTNERNYNLYCISVIIYRVV